MPPNGLLRPITVAMMVFGLPGSITMSITLELPVPGESKLLPVVTVSLVKVTDAGAAVALFDLKTPRRASGGAELVRAVPRPPMPVAVETKMVAGSAGWTRILLIDRPVKAL